MRAISPHTLGFTDYVMLYACLPVGRRYLSSVVPQGGT